MAGAPLSARCSVRGPDQLCLQADMVRPGQELDDMAGSPQEHAMSLLTAAAPVPWLARLTRASRQQAPFAVGEAGP